MDLNQHAKGTRLLREKSNIKTELEHWMKTITSSRQLAFCEKSFGNRPVPLNTSMAHHTFSNFRVAVIDELNLRLLEIDQEFSKLSGESDGY